MKERLPQLPIDMPTALITGASSGIGLELARVFAQNGSDLVLVARRKDILKELANELERAYGIKVTVLAHDLAQPESYEGIAKELKSASIEIDTLVNNAGFGSFGFFVDTDTKAQSDMIQVNVTALTELTRRLLPDMIERGPGNILNVASTAAFQPGPLMAVYFATKAYVLSLSVALANELKDTEVRVTALCPGPTTSGFQAVAFTKEDNIFSGRLPSSEEVARYGYAAMKKGRLIAVPGLRNKIGTLAGRLLPIKLVTAVIRRGQE